MRGREMPHVSNNAGNPHREPISLSAHWQPHPVATFFRHALTGPGPAQHCMRVLHRTERPRFSIYRTPPFLKRGSPVQPVQPVQRSNKHRQLSKHRSVSIGVQPRPRPSHAAGHQRFPKPIPFDSQKTGFGLNLTLSTTQAGAIAETLRGAQRDEKECLRQGPDTFSPLFISVDRAPSDGVPKSIQGERGLEISARIKLSNKCESRPTDPLSRPCLAGVS